MTLLREFGICLLAAFVAATLLGSTCVVDDCTPGETRCNLNKVEICGSDDNWYVNMNCDEVGGDTVDWACCWVPEDPVDGIPAGHTCLPGTTCPATADAGGGD